MVLGIHVLASLQNYDTSESKLRREFEAYGAIRRVSLLLDVMCTCVHIYIHVHVDMYSEITHAE